MTVSTALFGAVVTTWSFYLFSVKIMNSSEHGEEVTSDDIIEFTYSFSIVLSYLAIQLLGLNGGIAAVLSITASTPACLKSYVIITMILIMIITSLPTRMARYEVAKVKVDTNNYQLIALRNSLKI